MRYSEIRHYPAIARVFDELNELQLLPESKANEVRTESYQALYEKLTNREKGMVDIATKELRRMMVTEEGQMLPLGKQGAWELLVSLAQAMEWANWPEKGQDVS